MHRGGNIPDERAAKRLGSPLLGVKQTSRQDAVIKADTKFQEGNFTGPPHILGGSFSSAAARLANSRHR